MQLKLKTKLRPYCHITPGHNTTNYIILTSYLAVRYLRLHISALGAWKKKIVLNKRYHNIVTKNNIILIFLIRKLLLCHLAFQSISLPSILGSYVASQRLLSLYRGQRRIAADRRSCRNQPSTVTWPRPLYHVCTTKEEEGSYCLYWIKIFCLWLWLHGWCWRVRAVISICTAYSHCSSLKICRLFGKSHLHHHIIWKVLGQSFGKSHS